MKAGWIILVIGTVLSGCTTSYTVTPEGEEGGYSYKDLGPELNGKDGFVVLKGGKTIDATELSVHSDTVAWVEPVYELDRRTLGSRRVGETAHSAPITDVAKISSKDRALGGLEGLGLGLLAGTLGGMSVGGLGGGKSSSSDIFPSWFSGMIIGGAIGGGAGLLAGVVIGHSSDFEFHTADETACR